MADLPSTDRLYPSLLDRLRDDEPGNEQESRDKRIISVHKLREYVKRDLSWLLNTTCLEVTDDLTEFPEAANSVINFGVPELAGLSIDRKNLRPLEQRIKQSIAVFEPRLNSRGLHVKVTLDVASMNRHAMVVEISGELWGDPLPTSLYLKTEVDLETGDVSVAEQ